MIDNIKMYVYDLVIETYREEFTDNADHECVLHSFTFIWQWLWYILFESFIWLFDTRADKGELSATTYLCGDHNGQPI